MPKRWVAVERHAQGVATDNAAGKLTSVTYPSGRQLQISYTDGLPSSVAVAQTAGGSGTPLMTNLQYSPFGPLQSWNWAMNSGSVAHVRTFDASGRMQRYRIGPYLRENVYDEAGRIVGLKTFLVGADNSNGAYLANDSKQFAYDRAGRLTEVRTGTGNVIWTYAYDANGNRTAMANTNGLPTANYTISPSSNRLVSATYPNFTMTTDEAGNKTGDGWYSLSYDLRGRLATLSTAGTTARAPREALMNAGPSTSYTYDSAGLRVRKIHSWGAGGTQIFVYDQNQKLLGEYDANGNVLREYLWLDDMPIAVLTAELGAMQALPVHADHLNTPRAAVDLDGILRWSWFDPTDVFGKDYALPDPLNLGGSVTLNLRFPGQVYDGESGMHYNVHRDYVPSLGRYAQSDPIGLAGGINTYSYVGGNPLSFVDPKGLAAADVSMALDCIRELFPNMNVPSTFSFGEMRHPVTGNLTGGWTDGFTGNITFSRSMYGGVLFNGDLGGLAITATHEVMHANQNPLSRTITKLREYFGNESHNDHALDEVIRTRVDDCIRKKRDGKMCSR